MRRAGVSSEKEVSVVVRARRDLVSAIMRASAMFDAKGDRARMQSQE